jgi:hypothetical protein
MSESPLESGEKREERREKREERREKREERSRMCHDRGKTSRICHALAIDLRAHVDGMRA